MFLLCAYSEAFREILEWRASAHPFENVQSLLPPNSWLGLYPVPGKFSLIVAFVMSFPFIHGLLDAF
jgi:hypothetical protein